MLQILVLGDNSTDLATLMHAVQQRVELAKRNRATIEWVHDVNEVDAARQVVVVAFEAADLSKVDAHPTLRDRVFGLYSTAEAPPRNASTLWLKRSPTWPSRLADAILRFLEVDPARRPHLFISYQHADGAKAAAQLEAHLSGCGFRVFQDRRDIDIGQPLHAVISGSLADTDLLIRLRTPSVSKDATWMAWEAGVATLLGAGSLQLVWPRCVPFSAVRCMILKPEQVLADGSLDPSVMNPVEELVSFELAGVLAFRRARLAEGLVRIARSAAHHATYDFNRQLVTVTSRGHSARGAPPSGTYRPLPGLAGSRAYAEIVASKEHHLALVDGAACSADDGHEFWLQTALLKDTRVRRVDLLAEARSGFWVFHE